MASASSQAESSGSQPIRICEGIDGYGTALGRKAPGGCGYSEPSPLIIASWPDSCLITSELSESRPRTSAISRPFCTSTPQNDADDGKPRQNDTKRTHSHGHSAHLGQCPTGSTMRRYNVMLGDISLNPHASNVTKPIRCGLVNDDEEAAALGISPIATFGWLRSRPIALSRFRQIVGVLGQLHMYDSFKHQPRMPECPIFPPSSSEADSTRNESKNDICRKVYTNDIITKQG
ncbi:hypothetical protein CIRG_07666 [Coccidioides immitis RMSCC 2394]|uniref:Uncharacterized protein n=1 Tax=Coccidioides immitis RMSCC 2394 TaxID=404692 RepID=A0A0J6YK04_COCIT|nr:hypothetical protein CIRG_07666 [Coccidioides immitis RMSCC 2394]